MLSKPFVEATNAAIERFPMDLFSARLIFGALPKILPAQADNTVIAINANSDKNTDELCGEA